MASFDLILCNPLVSTNSPPISALASAVSVGLGWMGWYGVEQVLGSSIIAHAVAMMTAIVLTWSLYAVLALKLRLVNVPQLRKALRRDR